VRIGRHLLPLHDDRVLLQPERLLAGRRLHRLHAATGGLSAAAPEGRCPQWQAGSPLGVVWQLAAAQQ
jgi:hypothetical protein